MTLTEAEERLLATFHADPRYVVIRPILQKLGAGRSAAERDAMVDEITARVRRGVWRDFSPPSEP